MAENENGASSGNHDLLYLAGGLALIAVGVGLVATHPAVKKSLSAGISAAVPELKGMVTRNLAGIVPDLQRYLKLRSM